MYSEEGRRNKKRGRKGGQKYRRTNRKRNKHGLDYRGKGTWRSIDGRMGTKRGREGGTVTNGGVQDSRGR